MGVDIGERALQLVRREPATHCALGGLRGGISVALALSLSGNMYRDEFVLITYIIVVFSILVQGLTIGTFAKRLQTKLPI